MIFALPFALAPVFFFYFYSRGKHTEGAILAFVSILTFGIILGTYAVVRETSMLDTELWSGKVTRKIEDTQSCCHCRTVCDRRDKEGHCTSSHKECDHFRDYRWELEFSTGDHITVKDCSGSRFAPSVWTDAYVGEPAVLPHTFKNPFLATDQSLFIHGGTVTGVAPAYPVVTGLYKADRVISNVPNLDEGPWRQGLDELMTRLGPTKHVNIILIFTTNPNMHLLIERDWRYGKMNDAIFVLGVEDGVVKWAEVVTPPTGNSTLVENARVEIPGTPLDPAVLLPKIDGIVSRDWRWHSLEKFAYLAREAQPTGLGWLMVLVMTAICMFAGAIVIDKNNVKRRW